jgi:hypothetical protein
MHSSTNDPDNTKGRTTTAFQNSADQFVMQLVVAEACCRKQKVLQKPASRQKIHYTAWACQEPKGWTRIRTC